MAATKYTFRKHIKGDTFKPVQMTLTIDGVAQNLTGWQIKMMLKKKQSDTSAIQTWYIGHGITIVDITNGIFKIAPGIVNIAAGMYYYDIQFTTNNNEVKTWVQGTLTVDQDITT